MQMTPQTQALYDAIIADNGDAVTRLMAAGLNPNEPFTLADRTDPAVPPVLLAVEHWSAKALRSLIRAGADLHWRGPMAHVESGTGNTTTVNVQSTLLTAAMRHLLGVLDRPDDVKAVVSLVSGGWGTSVLINAQNFYGIDVLRAAITEGAPPWMLRILANAGAQPREGHGYAAAAAHNAPALAWLLEQGVEINPTKVLGAAAGGARALGQAVWDAYGEEREILPEGLRSPGALLAAYRAVEEVVLAHSGGVVADPDCKVVRAAARTGNAALVTGLVEQGPGGNRAQRATGALVAACVTRKAHLIDVLIAAGADPHVKPDMGAGLLHQVLDTGGSSDGLDECAVIGALLRHGVTIDGIDDRGQTPLLVAARRGRLAQARLLLESGAKRDCRDNEHNTPLRWCALNAQPEFMELLVSHGASPSGPGAEDDLLHALANGHTRKRNETRAARVARMLIDAGVPVDGRDQFGRTPLIRAAKTGAQGLMRELLALGADPDAAGDDGRTPARIIRDEWEENLRKDGLAALAAARARRALTIAAEPGNPPSMPGIAQ